MGYLLFHLLFRFWFLGGKFAVFLRLVSLDSLFPCFCLFLLCKFDSMVYHDLAVDGLAHLDVILVVIVVITSFDNHYYEENEIEVGKPMDCQVVVNHVVKLTAEEKAEARQNAVRKYQEEELRKLQNRHRPSARKENQPQPSLFDLGL